MMNHFMNQMIMYHEIHKQERDDRKPSQIAKHLGMDTRTVKKYLGMNEQSFLKYNEDLTSRSKKLLAYEDFVKEQLSRCPEASAAQVHDWLKEHHSDFIRVTEKTVYNFVLYVRNKYGLPKPFDVRQHMMVPELEYGKQAQADFGEYNMTDTDEHRKKVYFFAMVLSRSRYKYMFFSDVPFTSKTMVEAHERAFVFFGGYPFEVVYDQDKLILVKENFGDLLLTEVFRNYHQQRGFHLHFCRKSDPQSKGKIENVIKYIKYNFLRGRTFYDIHTLNGQGLEWLNRTANAKEHASTRKVPSLEWEVEKPHLTPLKYTIMLQQERIPHKVRKDNTVSFKGNYYALPDGTFQGNQTVVYIEQQDGMLILSEKAGEEIVRHKESLLKGVLVRNNNHNRDHSLKVKELINQVSTLFTDPSKALKYLERLHLNYPRYARDQVGLIATVCSRYQQADLDKALDYCLEHNISKATDFEPVIHALSQITAENVLSKRQRSTLDKYKYQIIPAKSNLSDYEQILN
jgi:transposase